MSIKRKVISAVLALAIILSSPFAIPHVSAVSLSAKSAVLICADTGEVLFEKNSRTRLPMASTTKIMTALVALECAELSETVTVSPLAAGIEGSSINLFAGEKIKLETLLYALMLESANDAAAAIAIYVAGSIEAFAEMMNEKAAELGLSDTHFTNPHGLYDESHYTSAYDLALIASHALKNEKFREIVSTYKISAPMTEGGASRLLVNHNKMLRIYDGAIGVKTGFTKKSGRCLVSAAERDGAAYVAVTLSAPDDWNDHKALLDHAFDTYEKLTLADTGELSYISPMVSGTVSFIKCTNTDPVYVYINKDNKNTITKKVELDRFYFAEIKKGDVLGRVIFFCDEKKVAECELVAAFDVPKVSYKKGLFSFFG